MQNEGENTLKKRRKGESVNGRGLRSWNKAEITGVCKEK